MVSKLILQAMDSRNAQKPKLKRNKCIYLIFKCLKFLQVNREIYNNPFRKIILHFVNMGFSHPGSNSVKPHFEVKRRKLLFNKLGIP